MSLSGLTGIYCCLQVAFTSPDYALDTLEEDISAANSSLEIYIYQINNDGSMSHSVILSEAYGYYASTGS